MLLLWSLDENQYLRLPSYDGCIKTLSRKIFLDNVCDSADDGSMKKFQFVPMYGERPSFLILRVKFETLSYCDNLKGV